MGKKGKSSCETRSDRSNCAYSKDVLVFNTDPNLGQMALSWEHGGATRMCVCVEAHGIIRRIITV